MQWRRRSKCLRRWIGLSRLAPAIARSCFERKDGGLLFSRSLAHSARRDARLAGVTLKSNHARKSTCRTRDSRGRGETSIVTDRVCDTRVAVVAHLGVLESRPESARTKRAAREFHGDLFEFGVLRDYFRVPPTRSEDGAESVKWSRAIAGLSNPRAPPRPSLPPAPAPNRVFTARLLRCAIWLGCSGKPSYTWFL